MSDIYYCSNSKIKKSRDIDSKGTINNNNNNNNSNNNNNEKSTKCLTTSGNGNNNNKTDQKDNNNICGKHTTSNGKSNWKAGTVHTNPNGVRDSTTLASSGHSSAGGGSNGVQQQTISTINGGGGGGIGGGTSSSNSTPQKVFHNTRCTRHHKSHTHNHGNGGLSLNGNGNDGSNGIGLIGDLSHHPHHHLSHHSHAHTHTHSHSGGGGGSSSRGSGSGSGCGSGGLRRKSESVLSTDSDIRFTRRKLGDSQKCGCAVIAGFLIALLVAGVFVYVGYTYFRPEPLPDRVFRGKFLVLNDKWSMELADQNSLRFQHKARDYKDRINLTLRRSDLRNAYQGSEILALDGSDDTNDVVVHFNMVFNPYAGLVSTADLLALFTEEMTSPQRIFFANMTVDPQSLNIKETTGIIEEPVMSSSPLGGSDETTEIITTTPKPPRRCEPLKLSYCRAVGYNVTTYPNLLGHNSYEEIQTDVIAFRELVDGECFREAYDFVCRLLQPPCELHGHLEPTAGIMCRDYCEQFMKGCGNRLPPRFKAYFDCETFPESTGIQTCYHKPHCANDMQSNAQSPRLCDGYADCPDLSDERTCTFCSSNALYCGRGRACVPRKARCDGKADCPDGSDEKDCLSIAPLAADLLRPEPLVPYLSRFYSEGYAVFSEKGVVGKLCAEGLEGVSKIAVRQTVAESLCKSLGYESVEIFEVKNDTEHIEDYVRVLDPHAPEISFIRTHCPKREVLYVGCGELRCGVQSVLSNNKQHLSLPKMSAPGDWPWLVALFREDIHVCDGTLISRDWVLTTESCFQGQPRATWMALFGTVRLSSKAPWTQRRRIIGLIKSPVEGSTAALVRLETSVSYSDHVRPICLPDELQRKQEQQIQRRSYVPIAERLEGYQLRGSSAANQQRRLAQETQQFFMFPMHERNINDDDHEDAANEDDTVDGSFVAEPQSWHMPHAEALTQTQSQSQPLPQAAPKLDNYPLPDSAPQVNYYGGGTKQPTVKSSTTSSQQLQPATLPEQIWTNCNTLGWSRQRDHLQRVQLKIGDMATCENVSIATVNSMCTEATYQKYDCTQEEYSGAPVQCLIPGTNQWALLGVSSWRIACGPTGVERPRMYDKITSNAPWIRETINAV